MYQLNGCALSRRAVGLAIILFSTCNPGLSRSLTLEECVNIALERNFDIRISKNDKARAAQDVAIANAEYLPEVSLLTSKDFSEQSNTGNNLDASKSETDFHRIQAKQNVNTGGTITLTTQIGRRDDDKRTNSLNPAYNSTASLRIEQPLLGGFGPAAAKAKRKLSEIDLKRETLEFQGAVIGIINDTEETYHDLVFAKEQLSLRETSLEVAKRLLDENKAKEETGIATSLDVLQAEVGVANARDQLIRAEYRLLNAQDDLTTLIGIEATDDEILVEELKIENFDHANYEAVIDMVLNNQPRYLSLIELQNRRSVELAQSRRNRLPDLGLDGTFAYTGLSGDRAEIVNDDGVVISSAAFEDAQDSFDDLRTGDSTSWDIGLRLYIPWGFKDKRAKYKKAKIALDTSEAQALKQRQLVIRDTRSAVRNVNTLIESLDIQKLETELSAQEFEMEKAKFDAGLSTGRRVLEAQQRMDSEQVDELRAQVNLLNAYASLRELDGSSLSRYGIEFD